MTILDTESKQQLALGESYQRGRLHGVMAAFTAMSKLDNDVQNSNQYQQVYACLEKLWEEEKKKHNMSKDACKENIENFEFAWKSIVGGGR